MLENCSGGRGGGITEGMSGEKLGKGNGGIIGMLNSFVCSFKSSGC